MDVENETKTEQFSSDDLCRLCANTDKQLIPIFQGEGIEHNIPEQIEKYLPIITVTQKDELPLKICYQCTSTLIAWHNFFEQCRSADNRLREILSVNIKFNQDDESYNDYADDFHDDLEDQALVNDTAPVECVLIEPKVSDLPIPNVSNEQIPPVSDRQIPSASDKQIPTVGDTQIPTIKDAPIMETSDDDCVIISKDESKSVSETVNDSRNAASVEEKWDPLTKTPQSCSTLLAEDRAKIVKSKQLSPLMRKCKELDVTILECDQCPAFFIDDSDFKKHKSTHVKAELSGSDEKAPGASASATHGSFARLMPRPKGGSKTRSGFLKLKIKFGSDAMTRKTTFVEKSEVRESAASLGSAKPTKKRISSGNSSAAECSRVTEDSVGFQKLKRKLETTKREETEAIDEDGDACLTKKLKKSSKHDESDAQSVVEEASSSVSLGESSVNSCASGSSRIRVANFAKDRFSDHGESGNTDSKSAQLKKVRLRRAQKDDDEGEETFTCAHCLRSFGRKSNLKRHMVKLHCASQNADKKAGPAPSKWFTGYCCDVCGEGLQHRPTMMAHREVLHHMHSEIDWVKYRTSLARVKFCTNCKKYYRSGNPFDEHSCDHGRSIDDASLAQRVRSAEEVRPKFVCSLCNDCFRWKWDYRLHRETEHDDAAPVDWTTVVGAELAHLCEQCSKAYSSADELAAHTCAAELRQQHASADETKKQYRCKLCDLEYFWKSDYRRHMRLKHPKEHCRPTEHDTIVYACPYCADKFTLKKGILQHMRKAHNVDSDSPFVCVKCNKVFRRRDNLDRHNESYHPAVSDEQETRRILDDAQIRINGDVTYRCALCNRHVADANRFVAHYRSHTRESKFKCDLCDKQTRTQHQLNTHIKNIHLNIRNYRCDLCEKSFYTKQACEEHRRIHTGERPYSCEICGKTFIAGNALISHKRFHNDFYPHSCHLCPKKFKVRRSLVNHVRTHTGERPFQCDLCPKTFNNSSQFSYHKKVTHSEERPFACPVCGNCFKANKFLTRHMELHNVPAQPHKTKRRGASGAEFALEAEDGDATVAQQATGDIVEERGIKIFVSAPTVVSAAPLAHGPSIVSVVSTMSTTILKSGHPVGLANVGFQDENILPGPNPLFDGESDYDQYAVKTSGRADPAAYMTTVEYVQMTNGEFKPLITDDRYVSAVLQPESGRHAGAKNVTWL